jgi:hypothetical protein
MTVKKLRPHDKAKTSAKQREIFNKFAAKINYVSIFSHKQDNQPGRTKLTFEMTRHDFRPDKDGVMFNASRFNGTRGNEKFVSANAMFLDFDKGNPTIEEIRASFSGNLMLIYTTHSHTPEKPRYRVVFPLSRAVNKSEHIAIGRALKEKLTPKLRKCLDETCTQRARPHYLPACPPNQADNVKSRFFDGSPLNANKLVVIGKEIPSEKVFERGTKADKSGDRPGDDYVRRHSIKDLMLENGWTPVKGNKWSKPGDTSGDHQAKLYHDGVYVYSTSAPVPDGYHDAFSFLVHSHYGGDFSAAAADLKKKGYGGAATASNSALKRLFITPSQLQNNQRETDSLVGNLITSCVVNYGKKPEHSSKKTRTGSPKLSDIESIAVKGLVLASVECQEQVGGKYGADIETWRSAFYELRKEQQDEDITQETLKKSFSRAKKNLLELEQIEEVEKVITLTNPAHQAKIKDKIG